MRNPAESRERAGLGYALAAYGWWGSVIPIWFYYVAVAGAWNLLVLRLLLGLPALLLLVVIGRQWRDLLAVPKNAAARWRLPITAPLLGLNWFGYVYATVNSRTLEASLGYFTNPLVSVALGAIFLGERLRRAQKISVLLASIGVLVSMVGAFTGDESQPFPWIMLTLAFSFGFYGLLRKQADVPAMVGLAGELIILAPIGAVGLVLLIRAGSIDTIGGLEWWRLVLLSLAGFVTLAPLVWFNSAARRLPLKTVGLLQYIAPTGQFLLGLWLYGEELGWTIGITFAFVWAAVIIYCHDLIAASRESAAEKIT